MSIKHKFTSAIADDPTHPEWVRPSNWNDDHDLNITDYTELTSPGSDDTLLIEDKTTGTIKHIKVSNLPAPALPDFVIGDNLDLIFTNDGGFVLKE